MHRGQVLVDLCAGTQGPLDPRPVRPNTLFCVFSAGKGVCATAIHLLVDRGLVRYDQRLVEFWPEFGVKGKENTTVRHVLTHSTGLQHAFPDSPTFDNLCDWESMMATLEGTPPAWPPGSRSSYHYFTFGWLTAGVVEHVSGMTFPQFVRTQMAVPLGLEDSFFMGDLGTMGIPDERIASVEHALPVGIAPGSGESSEGGGGVSSPVGVGEEEEEEEEGVGRALGMLGEMAKAVKEEDPEEGAALEDLSRKLRGREYLLDPRVFNYRQMREACIPAANGHFTARALATLYDNFLTSMGLSAGVAAMAREEGGRGDMLEDVSVGIGVADAPPLLSRTRVNEMRAYQVH
ncbi:unnamed protein product [Choristocarpus tenellus]